MEVLAQPNAAKDVLHGRRGSRLTGVGYKLALLQAVF